MIDFGYGQVVDIVVVFGKQFDDVGQNVWFVFDQDC